MPTTSGQGNFKQGQLCPIVVMLFKIRISISFIGQLVFPVREGGTGAGLDRVYFQFSQLELYQLT